MVKLNLKQNKFDYLTREIEAPPRVQTAYVPLSVGGRESLTVSVFEGDRINAMQPLAQPDDGKGPVIYSPFSGRVVSTKKFHIPGIGKVPCAEIKVMDVPEQQTSGAPRDIRDLTVHEILTVCKKAGIIDELEGGRLWDKLDSARLSGRRLVVADAVEDDPYAAAGLGVLLQYGDEVAKGLALIGKVVGATEQYIDVFAQEAGQFPSSYDDVLVRHYCGAYPQHYRLQEALDKGDGVAVGVQAARALYRAAAYGEKQTQMVVTVGGDFVVRPGNYRVQAGTRVSDLLFQAGAADDIPLLLAGGSVTGTQITPDTPVYLGLTCITALKDTGMVRQSPCIGCGRCVMVCPKKLMPNYILEEMQTGIFTNIGRDAVHCVACGCCTLVCPSRHYVTQEVLAVKELVLKRQDREVV